MRSLYLLPPPALIALPMLLAVAIILEISVLMYEIFRISHQKDQIMAEIQEFLLFLQLLLFTVIAAQTIYHGDSGFFVLHSYRALRYTLAAGSAALGIYLICRQHKLSRFLLACTMGLTLPVMEFLPGSSFAWLLLLLLLLWICRAGCLILYFHRTKQHRLSAYSVKEAMDAMDQGLLFCKYRGRSDGQTLICNRKMEDLMQTLTGKFFFNGQQFYEQLLKGDILPECQKYPSQSLMLFRLPDGKIWEFKFHHVLWKSRVYALLMASDDTEIFQATDRLRQKEEALQNQNQELSQMLKNMEATCKTEEIIHMKSRIHDLLGQKITILLRSMREHQKLDSELLASIVTSLDEGLRGQNLSGRYSLEMLIRDFKGLGVTVTTTGSTPRNPEVQRVFFEIITEAMTNAVRHGYATEICVETSVSAGQRLLTIRNNGLSPDTPISEGGGFAGMRRKAEMLGGSFRYEAAPQFTISITIPEGEDI